MKFSAAFPKIESIQTSVIFTSSEEAGEGEAANLTDGDPNTIWHTMYRNRCQATSLADMDAGEVKP